MADQDTSNSALQEQIRTLRKKAELLVKAEKNFFSQKAGLKHRLLSDRNTAFFHAMVRTNNTRNTISFLCKSDGGILEDQEEIAESFVNFYKGLFGVPKQATPLRSEVVHQGYVLSNEESNNLIMPVTNEEIKGALFLIKDDKAPGPDGYSSAFYKKNWGTLGMDIIEAVAEFFESGHLLKSFNTTAIALIPKTVNNPQVSDYRPLACCNVFYKIITKILSRRLDPLLPKLVNQAQSAFVPGRNIMGNIHLATELMRRYDRARTVPRCTVKIDLRKAYDTIC